MSMRVAEIKVLDNPRMLERYIRKDDEILYQMAKDMMKENSRLIAITVNSKDGFGVGLYNIDTKDNIITALPKWKDSDLLDTKETSYLISNIFHDLSKTNDLTFGAYDANHIEDDIKNIIQNNSAVIEKNVSVVNAEMSPVIIDDVTVEFDYSQSSFFVGSLFDEELSRKDTKDISINDFEKVFGDMKNISAECEENKRTEQTKRAIGIEKDNMAFQSMSVVENSPMPSI